MTLDEKASLLGHWIAGVLGLFCLWKAGLGLWGIAGIILIFRAHNITRHESDVLDKFYNLSLRDFLKDKPEDKNE